MLSFVDARDASNLSFMSMRNTAISLLVAMRPSTINAASAIPTPSMVRNSVVPYLRDAPGSLSLEPVAASSPSSARPTATDRIAGIAPKRLTNAPSAACRSLRPASTRRRPPLSTEFGNLSDENELGTSLAIPAVPRFAGLSSVLKLPEMSPGGGLSEPRALFVTS